MTSRVGKLPIKVADDVEIEINGTLVTVKRGDKIKTYNFGNKVTVLLKDKELIVKEKEGEPDSTMFSGLHRSNLYNIIKGLVDGFKIILEYNGVGYKANMFKDYLILGLGYSHSIAVKIPKNIVVTPEKPNLIVIQGEDKEAIGTLASRIISLRRVEPYKGKGIKYQGQEILRKEGKKK
jgi:large subunit ribosomal protein L6